MPVTISITSLERKKGKTALIEKIVRRLTDEGFKVATVKHTPERFDVKGKDSWRHMEAGSLKTVIVTPKEVVSIEREANPGIEEALRNIDKSFDFVLIEGFRQSKYPKILCADHLEEVEKAVDEIKNLQVVTGKILRNKKEIGNLKRKFPDIKVYELDQIIEMLKELLFKDILKRLPGLDCGHCKYGSCLEMAKAILKGEAKLNDCVAISTNIASLKIDEKIVPLTTWPQKVLKEIALGFAKSVKLRDINIEKAKKIEIEVNL